LFVGQLVKKGLEEKNLDVQLETEKKNIVEMETCVALLEKSENTLIENIKFLTNLREKMA